MRKHFYTQAVIRATMKLVRDYNFLCRSRFSPTQFTRKGKIGFVDSIIFLLSGMKNSLQSELNRYLDMMNRKNETYSKQAFSKGRQRIRPEAIKELSDNMIDLLYQMGKLETFMGFYLLAIDGSRYNLPTNPDLLSAFGEQKTGGYPQPQALGSCLFDVLNGFVVDACFGRCTDSERDHASDMIRNLNTEIIKRPLYIMDRGYPDSKLMRMIEKSRQHYLMRCDHTFIRSVNWNGTDDVVTHKFKSNPEPVTFRIIKINLSDVNYEYLITNLTEEKYNSDIFKKLYALRWGIESKYDDLKNKMQIENFTGSTPVAVCQDYYATLYLANLASTIVLDSHEDIEAIHNIPENKNLYKMNFNQTIGALKTNVVELLMCKSTAKANRILNKIVKRLSKCVVTINRGRCNERKIRHAHSKYPMNKKLS